MNLNTVRYDLDADGLATLTVNRPEKLNALNAEVLDDLEQAFRQARWDQTVRGVVVTGAGEKSFVAGADIAQFQNLDALTGEQFARRGQTVFNQIEQMPKPVVAAVNGHALGGGCELALACHLRTASDSARFGLPEVGLGIIPGYGATQRLPRLIGGGRATELVLTGEPIDAEHAHRIGLVSRVVPADRLLDAAKALLRTVTSKAPVAVRLALEALRTSDQPLEQGLRHEAALFGQATSTEDAREGAAAFLEQREPDFQGR